MLHSVLTNIQPNLSSFNPKLIVKGNLIPAVKTGDSFRYLGSHIDFKMSTNNHKFQLSEITNAILTDRYRSELSASEKQNCSL